MLDTREKEVNILIFLLWTGTVGSGRLRSAQVGSSRLRSAQVGSGWLRSAQVGSGRLRSAQVSSGRLRSQDFYNLTNTSSLLKNTEHMYVYIIYYMRLLSFSYMFNLS